MPVSFKVAMTSLISLFGSAALGCTTSEGSSGNTAGSSTGSAGVPGSDSDGGLVGSGRSAQGSGGATPGGGGSTNAGGMGDGGADMAQGGMGQGGMGQGGAASTSCDAAGAAGSGAPLLACDELPGSCGDCIASNACDLFQFECATDADCVCLVECVSDSGLGDTDVCLASCGLDGSPAGFHELAEEVAVMCPDGDECSVPQDYAPPANSTPEATSNASIGGGVLEDCSFDSTLAYDPDGEILQLESSDGNICVRVDRRNDGSGNNANTSWALLDMMVGPLGEVCHSNDLSTLCWYSSHHNFNDWAHVWCGNRHYDLEISLTGHGAAPSYLLHVFEGGPLEGSACAPAADGFCRIGDPIELVAVQ